MDGKKLAAVNKIDLYDLSKITESLGELSVVGFAMRTGADAFAKQLREFQEQIEDQIETSEEDEDDLIAFATDYYVLMGLHMPRLNAYANFLLAYAVYERGINEICIQIQKMRQLHLGVKDLAGQGVPRALVYLRKVALLKIEEDRVLERIRVLNDLRNVVAHKSGYIEFGSDAYKRFSKLRAIQFSPDEDIFESGETQVILPLAFVENALRDFQQSLRTILASINELTAPLAAISSVTDPILEAFTPPTAQ
jgi:hypothetical protein